jgi:methylenetetrahydrofolate/methylenetetrahydromethanopterin dehydrogenase (NADP+)
MSKPKILLQLDTDIHPSVFDSVVAVDAGVDQLFRHHGVKADQVRDLVYGLMFTRGPEDLHNSAIFIGGTDVAAGEVLMKKVSECFVGPFKVSVMLDSSGANTTAAAAVLAANKHVDLSQAKVLVLAATGSVGRRVVKLLARAGADVRAASRTIERAQDVCADIHIEIPTAKLSAHATVSPDGLSGALDGVEAIIACGAPGVPLLSAETRQKCKSLKVAIDLSAVPPLGLEGIEIGDKAKERDGALCYGALGVGGTKMKIHKAALRRLFDSNDAMLDAETIYALGQTL